MFAFATFTRIHRRWLQSAFAVYLVALALVVFLPSQQAGTVTGFVGVIAGWLYFLGVPRSDAAVAVEFVSNIVMFIPFGALLRCLWPATWNWWRTLLLSAATSTAIELTQLLVPGRVTALSDVIANSAGGLIGVAAVAWLVSRRSR
ncbi:VanZ family protein [Paenarthrobacter ilicis]|uniref:VanZ family protein n=1 Tax=Paenarthrobacter ilicis TaxID=43665 RepID=UPI0028D39E2F|nr:VanZ family protein [Paenarthrobacter ilicis]